ncbi:MAG: S-layer homology domain-containing protein [Solirubrobacterales bacterium]
MRGKTRTGLAVLLLAGMLLSVVQAPAMAASTAAGPLVQPNAPVSGPAKDVSTTLKSYPYIQFLMSKGVMGGYPDGTFKPYGYITRAEMMAILCKVGKVKAITPKKPSFKDVNPKYWAYPYIEGAKAAGMTKGYAGKLYKPNGKITRAELASLLLALSKEPAPPIASVSTVTDVSAKHWARAAILIAADSDMIVPINNKFHPDWYANRGDVATALGMLISTAPQLRRTALTVMVKPTKGQTFLTVPGGREQSITTETAVPAGSTIRTGDTGEADLSYPDGSSFLCAPKTVFRVKSGQGQMYIRADGTPGTAIDKAEVELTQGKFYGVIATSYLFNNEEKKTAASSEASKTFAGPSADEVNSARLFAGPPGDDVKKNWYKEASAKRVRVQVDMPWGVAGIRGTILSCGVGAGTQSISCADGSVSVSSSAGGTVSVSSGQGVSTGSDGATSTPAPMSASEKSDFAAQAPAIMGIVAAVATIAPAPAPQPITMTAQQEAAMAAAQQAAQQAEQAAAAAAASATAQQAQQAATAAAAQAASAAAAAQAAAAMEAAQAAQPAAPAASPVATVAAVTSAVQTMSQTLDVAVPQSVSTALAAAATSTGTSAASTTSGTTNTTTTTQSTTTSSSGGGGGGGGGTTTTTTTTLIKPDGLADVKMAAGGMNHVVVLKTNGTVWTYGANGYGQCGNGNTDTVDSMFQVSGLSNIVAVAAGANYSMALTEDGYVYAWGDNQYGQLGIGSTPTSSLLPVKVKASAGVDLSGVKTIAAGYNHALAVMNDGQLKAWGRNSEGQLGDGSTTPADAYYPTNAGLTNVVQVAAGYSHSMALNSSKQVYVWGSNMYGQQGSTPGGTQDTYESANGDRSTPTAILAPGYYAIAAGGYHCLARGSSSVYSWGRNDSGQLGRTTANPETPAAIPDTIIP